MESFFHLLTVLGGGEQVASRAKMLRDRSIRSKEALGVTRRLEALHPALPLTRRLVGVLGAIVHIAVLPMFHPRQEFSLGGAVAFQLVGDKHPWHVRQAFEQLTKELFCGVLIPPVLHQDIENLAILIDHQR